MKTTTQSEAEKMAEEYYKIDPQKYEVVTSDFGDGMNHIQFAADFAFHYHREKMKEKEKPIGEIQDMAFKYATNLKYFIGKYEPEEVTDMVEKNAFKNGALWMQEHFLSDLTKTE